ncbi:MAG: M14 family metallopeptidase [Rhodothermia bacterium]
MNQNLLLRAVAVCCVSATFILPAVAQEAARDTARDAARDAARDTVRNPAETPILPPLVPWSGASESLIASDDDPWITPSELSGLTATPSYDETMSWLTKLAEEAPQLHLSLIGTSLEQRDIMMVVASAEGARTPTELRENGKPTLLAHAGIHSGEIDGKDAGLMLLRDLTVGDKLDLLDRVNLLFIPILSVDGHERSSAFNRINQRGPTEMGWRTNSRNLNLNRDFSKLDTEGVAALVLVINDWDPDLYLDLHVTDGADYQADITYGYNGPHAWSPEIADWLDTVYRPNVDAALLDAGHVPGPLLFGVNGVDMTAGNFEWTASPRFSTGYSDARHLPAVLLENHSLKPYRQRVLGTYVFLQASLEALATGFEDLQARVKRDESRHPDPLPLDWKIPESPPATMTHAGIRSETYDSEIAGGKIVRWLGEPVELEIPVVGAFEGIELTARPEAYYIPAAWSSIVLRLMTHGIELERVLERRTVPARMYRLPEAKIEGDVFEGHVRVSPGELVVEERDLQLAPGSYIVRTDQPLGDLAMLLLEPRSPDSFFQWGFFLEVLQRTEYVEQYVMEPMAARMMAEDPDLRAEFDAAVAADTAFAADPRARLQWFYERTPFFDEEYRLYPIGRSLE